MEPHARAALRRRAARVRRRAFERVGSDRHSRPGRGEVERALAHHLPSRPGYFVEAGAADGLLESNTYWLERFRGWRGLLVEPIPALAAACRAERPGARTVQCALTAAAPPGATVTMRYAGLMSLVAGAMGSSTADDAHVGLGCWLGGEGSYAVEVPARTLSDVLDEAGAPGVDLLCLDVEGFEAEVLRGLDQSRHRPGHVLVEMLDGAAGRARIEPALGPGYDLVALLGGRDALYRRAPNASDRPG